MYFKNSPLIFDQPARRSHPVLPRRIGRPERVDLQATRSGGRDSRVPQGCRRPSRRRRLSSLQNPFGNPACFRIALAKGRLSMFAGTVKVRFVIGLNQISWLPLPSRSKRQPAASNSAVSGR